SPVSGSGDGEGNSGDPEQYRAQARRGAPQPPTERRTEAVVHFVHGAIPPEWPASTEAHRVQQQSVAAEAPRRRDGPWNPNGPCTVFSPIREKNPCLLEF